MPAEELLLFWFGDAPNQPEELSRRKKIWFLGDDAFELELRRRFADVAAAAARGDYESWRTSPRSALALLLLLDQLPRNLHRDAAASYAQDARALALAEDMLGNGFDKELEAIEAAFVGMPFEHAEDLGAQDRSVAFFRELLERAPRGSEDSFGDFVAFAERHREVIRRFGRFPHRNQALGRSSTPEEEAFLRERGRGFD